MALTQSELEAKLEALEERIAIFAQLTEQLEARFDNGLAHWERCLVDMQTALERCSLYVNGTRQASWTGELTPTPQTPRRP